MLKRHMVTASALILSISVGAATPLAAQQPPSTTATARGQARYSPEVIRRDILDYLVHPTIRSRMIQQIESDFGMAGWRVVAEEITGDFPDTRRYAAELLQCSVAPGAPRARSSECVSTTELPALRALMVPQLYRSLDMSGDHVSAWHALKTLQATDSATFSRAIQLRLHNTDMPIVHEMMGRADYERQLPELVSALAVCRQHRDQFCEEQVADWIGHAGTAAAPYAQTFEAMVREDMKAHRLTRATADLLATSGDLEALRPILTKEEFRFVNPNGLGVTPPAAGVAFLISLLEHPNTVNVDFLSLMLTCYGKEAIVPARAVMVRIVNDTTVMHQLVHMDGVGAAMRVMRGQEEPSGECVQHSGVWRNP